MSSLNTIEECTLEKCLRMETGYVLSFTDSNFRSVIAEAVGLDIHDAKYAIDGKSKAKKLRVFWRIEDDYQVGRVIDALLAYEAETQGPLSAGDEALFNRARKVSARLQSGGPRLSALREKAQIMDARYLSEQIERMESAVQSDPWLAIGTAKELVETCCKTILAARGEAFTEAASVAELSKATFKVLELVAAEVPDQKKGAEVIRRVLNNLATIGVGLAELRNSYGTGHGKHGRAGGLTPRHAKLAVGAAATLVTFLFETHSHSAIKP